MMGWMLMGMPFALGVLVLADELWPDLAVPVVVGLFLSGAFVLGALMVAGVVQ